MTIVARAEQLVRDVAGLDRLQQAASNRDALRTRAENLSSPVERLERLALAHELLLRHGVPIELASLRLTQLSAHCEKIAAEFAADPSNIVDPSDARFSFWKVLPELPNRLEAALGSAWKTWAQERARIDLSLLTVLERVPGLRAAIQMIRFQIAAAERIAAELPTTETAFTQLDEVASAIRDAWGKLPISDGEDEEIRTFVSRAGTEGAPLPLLTSGVAAWIEEHGLTNAFRIWLGRSGSA